MQVGSPTSRVIATIATADSPTPVIGGAAVLATSRDIAASAQTVLRADTFRTTSAPNVDAIADAAGRGVDVHALVDSANAADDDAFVTRLGGLASATVTAYGDDPFKQHGKAISRDGVDALVASDVSDAKSMHRLEMGVRFGGRAAAAFDAAQQLDAKTPHDIADAAFDRARAAGVVLNDPHHDRHDVSDAVKALVDGASNTLLITTRELDADGLAKRIAAAAERGVATIVAAHELDDHDASAMRRAGVDVRTIDYDAALARDVAMHGTLVAADDHALVTTMPLIKRAIDGNAHRRSRELGAIVDGAPAHAFVDAARGALALQSRS